MGHGPELAQRMMDQSDRDPFCWSNGPTAAQKVYLVVGIDSSAQMERQMQIQERGERARTDRRAPFHQRLVPSRIGTLAGGAADRAILVGQLAIQDDLGGGVIGDVFVSQKRYQALLQGSKSAFDFTFGLRARGDQMGHAQGGEGALELRRGISIIGHGIMTKEAQAIGIDNQRQVVL